MNKNRGALSKIVSAFLDLIYPERGICFLCDEYDDSVEDDHICSSCREKLVFTEGHKCTICGKLLTHDLPIKKCGDCLNHNHNFSKAISVLEYKGLIKESIYKYKYGKKAYMYRAFGPLLVQALRDNNITERDIDFIVPVPLHRSKFIKRGFNQAELLGRYISKNLNIPLNINNLSRIKKTTIQNKLHRLERLKNIKFAFSCKENHLFEGKNILLVDDIYTTGATVDECSRILLKSGANKVVVICLATGKSS